MFAVNLLTFCINHFKLKEESNQPQYKIFLIVCKHCFHFVLTHLSCFGGLWLSLHLGTRGEMKKILTKWSLDEEKMSTNVFRLFFRTILKRST